MRLKIVLLVAGALAIGFAGTAIADLSYTQGSGTTIFDFTCFTTKHCSAHTSINSAGTEIFTSSTPAQVTGANGTFPATQSGTWNITNVSGTVSLPTGAATSANQPTNAAQASTTSGQTGNLVQCAVTTSAPTYTNATTNPINCDTAGNQRVTVTNANANGQATMANSSPVVIASNQSAVAVTGTLATSGGWTPKRLSALTNSATAIKSSAAGQLGMLLCNNSNASVAYVQVFDVATAGGVTLGTTTPTLAFAIPATNSDGFTLSLQGIQFANGIQVAATTTATGSTALGTALDCNAAFN